ncbi:hypothetical protein TUMSATVNIG3_22680 [Vibrio nigripulchritudo]|nr:hypothetical protein TUMSATVNIG2_22190 [Vibrio nigripulchritudo]BDU43470.1 hypothetical protein TUMSATVNIG3_22680 [Vibrio nigripulchritudo]
MSFKLKSEDLEDRRALEANLNITGPLFNTKVKPVYNVALLSFMV